MKNGRIEVKELSEKVKRAGPGGEGMYAVASIPETEVFGANKFEIPGHRRDPLWSLDQPHSEMVHRFASSAAHVAGRNLMISESFTWLRNHFHTALSHIKPEADRLLPCGINGIYYHGTCFSPEKTACGEAGRWLMQRGHPFDFVSDSQIGTTRLENGQLITEGGAAYRTVLVPAAKFMKIETARRLIEPAKAGASIVIWKSLPQGVPGWHNYSERENELEELLVSLNFVDGVATVGKGRILLGDDLAVLMSADF